MPSRHPIVEIVDANDGHVNVAPGSVDEVIAADSDEIAVAAKDHHLELRVGQLEPGGEGDSPPVGGMKGIQLDIASHSPRAADARNDSHLVQIQA